MELPALQEHQAHRSMVAAVGLLEEVARLRDEADRTIRAAASAGASAVAVPHQSAQSRWFAQERLREAMALLERAEELLAQAVDLLHVRRTHGRG